MAHAISMKEHEVISIVERAAELIARLDTGLFTRGPVELRETLDVWLLRLDAILQGAHQDADVSAVATDAGRYHHQITIGGSPEVFARSSIPATQGGLPTVEELFKSPLAKNIDEGIEWIDKQATGDPLVHLLVVPSYYLTAMWLVWQAQPSRVLIVDVGGAAPASLDKDKTPGGLKGNQLYGSSEFLFALADAGPGMGAMGVCPGGHRGKP